MLYNITNKDCKIISTKDFIHFLFSKYPNESFSDIIYERVTVKDSADNYYNIISINNKENNYALIDTIRGIVIVIDDAYVTGYKALLDKLLEDGYRITYND